jgi:hypothetical protein
MLYKTTLLVSSAWILRASKAFYIFLSDILYPSYIFTHFLEGTFVLSLGLEYKFSLKKPRKLKKTANDRQGY